MQTAPPTRYYDSVVINLSDQLYVVSMHCNLSNDSNHLRVCHADGRCRNNSDFFMGEPPFEAHRVKILFRDILERSLDAVKCGDDAMPVVAGPYVARVFERHREKIDAQLVNQLVLF